MKTILQNEKLKKGFLAISFACFLCILTWLITFKLGANYKIEECHITLMKRTFISRLRSAIVPFFLKKQWKSALMSDILPNLIAFMPFGFYLPLFNKKHTFLKGVLIAFLISLAFELCQLITSMGCFDINDLFANTLGYVVGYILYLLLIKQRNTLTINSLNLIISVIAIPVCIYAINSIINNLPFYLQVTREYLNYLKTF